MNGWAPNPAEVIRLVSSGNGDMGDISESSSRARFKITNDNYVLIFIRVHFSGVGTGTADIDIVLDSKHGPAHDVLLDTITARGKDSDLFLRIPREEYEKWVFGIGDEIVLVWTNPVSNGQLKWGVEIGLANVVAGQSQI